MSAGNFNYTPTKDHSYDAIVIGSGISGGWAAKELCEGGLKTLVVERGRNVVHLFDYPTTTKDPWEFDHGNVALPLTVEEENPIVKRCYAFEESTEHFFVKDKEHPYVQEKPFDWIRGYQVGGKSLTWARQTQRWSKYEFEGPKRDKIAEWPIGYDDLAPWYSHVELFAGISGNLDGLETLPDGEFLPPWEMNTVEKVVQKRILENYHDRNVIIGRCAHLTVPKDIHLEQGRGQCQARSLCHRGCPYGGYFSSNSSTLPTANKTGNLTMMPDSVVHSIIYDDKKGKATGVKVINAHTKVVTEYYAKIIFVNAATLNTNLILLNSTSARFPNGLGNDSGLLGKYIAFHNYRGRVSGRMEGYEDTYYYGRRPTLVLIPNFRNVHKQEMDFLRGYQSFFTAAREGWQRHTEGPQIGAGFKDNITEPGSWWVSMGMQGETIPKESNKVYLDKDQKDEWGMPLLVTSVGYDENDEKITKDFLQQATEMLQKAGCKDITQHDSKQAPGLDIHEVGGVRMGKDPKTSLLNKWNQLHGCPNVFVTDGACMASTGVQNPSLTFMALTARAAAYAIAEFKKGSFA